MGFQNHVFYREISFPVNKHVFKTMFFYMCFLQGAPSEGGGPLKMITESGVLEAISLFFLGFWGDPPVMFLRGSPPLKRW